VVVPEVADQSIMVTKLPSLNVNSHIDETLSRKEFTRKLQPFFKEVFEGALNDIERIVKIFEDKDFAYLGSRQMDFFCPCSKDRMVVNLRTLYSADVDDLFKDQEFIEVKCDYCRKTYEIYKSDVIGS
jgi:molecular chaperone Hsp33